MIARIWGAHIDAARSKEYERFAHDRSLPTCQAHDGFLGCAFLGDGEQRIVLTLWRSAADIDALERSDRYRETVAEITKRGFILSAAPATVAPVVGQR